MLIGEVWLNFSGTAALNLTIQTIL
jgi:hypothetical protein